MLKTLPVHMLWVSGDLSPLARLSLASFRAQGFTVRLWSYDPKALGEAAEDARAILPLADGEAGNLAWLTSLFRYLVLARQGGIWSDMDVVALEPDPVLPVQPFVASEKRRPFRHAEPTATGDSLTQVTNCLMANPRPAAVALHAHVCDDLGAAGRRCRSAVSGCFTGWAAVA